MDLSGRGVFLTGGAQGIGRCMTASLLEKGARVLFCDIEADTGKATEEELQKQYGADSVSFLQCDITDADKLKAVFEAAVRKFGAVEICANNAAISDQKNWEKMFAVNAIAHIRACQIAFEHMRRDKGGRGGVIINTVSSCGFSPTFMIPVYTASKHAMLGYTTSCASDPDMPALGVRWCCLCPGPVRSRLLDEDKLHMRVETLTDTICQIIRSLKLMEPEDVARAFIQQLEDVDNNGKIMHVTHDRGGVYRQRILVDEDGVSNPLEVDKPLTQHPPVPGHTQ